MNLAEMFNFQLRKNNWEVIRTTNLPENWLNYQNTIIKLMMVEIEAMILE